MFLRISAIYLVWTAIDLVTLVKGSCPEYGAYYKGKFCIAANGLEWWEANSWQECRERCKSNLFSAVPCGRFAWDSNGGTCTLQNGDNNCREKRPNIISGTPNVSVTGSCATTCTVGSWSEWSNTCVPKVYGGITYRTRKIVSKPKYPLEKCPHLQEVVNCSDRNWGKMSSAELNDENSALSHVLSGKIQQSALGKDTSALNCPNYDVGVLGWGCSLEDDLNYGNLVKTESYTWQDCLNRCKQRSDCTNFNFRTTGTGTSPCYLILGEIGCSFHSIGWISGSKNLAVKYGECDVNCVLGEWTQWSGCDSAVCMDGKAYSKRIRPVITSQRGSGAACSKTRELKECTASYTCMANSCVVGDWSSWSSCRENCNGEIIRRRTVQQIPSPGGTPCPHLFEISKDTNCAKKTDIYGIFSNTLCLAANAFPWSAWSGCSSDCGGGFRIRKRASVLKQYSAESCNQQQCSTYKVENCNVNFSPNSLYQQFNRLCLITGYYNSKDHLKLLVEHEFRV
ncbi:TSP1 domain-containing protein TSP3 precursor [Cryptosporidium canis]|uniref:TSP1 domain-containing protein TSP3 n=1 Tax=Cryptosporidium canis TaxID=195482 RepID=A0A9D5DJC2_9CRYT|nr:TSP1 domain-containing protein TSP3 precursor [Cryptosporidium canis]